MAHMIKGTLVFKVKSIKSLISHLSCLNIYHSFTIIYNRAQIIHNIFRKVLEQHICCHKYQSTHKLCP